jgi:hypothetical protein
MSRQSLCTFSLSLLVFPVLTAAEMDWHRSALSSDKPNDEILHLTIGGAAKPNVLERWWNGRRVRWLDEGGTMQPDDRRGDLINSVLQVDLNGDGAYDGDGDLTVKWCDTNGDGVPDVQAVVVSPSGWNEQKKTYANQGQWAVMLNHDRRGAMWWIDWEKFDFHHACWDKTGECAWLTNYHGNNDFVKAIHAPHLMTDPRLAWECPFSFYDEDGTGVSKMTIRWAAPLSMKDGKVAIPPTLDRCHVSYDLDGNAGKDHETSYDMTLYGTGGAVDISGMHHPLPHFAGNPIFDPCFQHNEWRRVNELIYMNRDKGYETFFQTPWKGMSLVFDEDGDDHRWERVEMYFPTDNKNRPVDIFSASAEMSESTVPGPSYHPQADSLGDRGEFDLTNKGGGKLYVGRFDHKIHLYGADWGVWLVDKDAAFHGGAGAQSGKPRAQQVGEVVKYTDTDGDGFIDTIAFSYKGDRHFDFTVSLKDFAKGGDDPQKAELIDPRALGWKGMHEMYLKLSTQAWDDALAIYRAAWKRDLTSPELDRLAAGASLRQRHINAWWITEGVFRAIRQRVLARIEQEPTQAEALRRYLAELVAANYSGRTADTVRLIAACPP